MLIKNIAALVHALLAAGVALFQLALAAGAPWGAYAMGGAVSGTFPPALRMAALVQALLMVLMALVVLARAGLMPSFWPRPAGWPVWAVVAVSALSALLNLLTPSAGERALWAPVALLLLASSVVVARSRPTSV